MAGNLCTNDLTSPIGKSKQTDKGWRASCPMRSSALPRRPGGVSTCMSEYPLLAGTGEVHRRLKVHLSKILL